MTDDRVVLITGTRKGIGKYLAQYYVAAGYQVIGCSRGPADYQLENYRHFCLDVADETEATRMFSKIRRIYNRLDVLINNAGIESHNPALLTSSGAVQDILSTNVVGTFLFCREACKLMKKNSHGRIVNLSTVHVRLGTVGTSIYGASKAAVEQFTAVLAKEVAPFGITVNTLGLSLVDKTGMSERLTKKAASDLLERTTLKRQLSLLDVAHAMDFLISNNSHMITNQLLYLGGV